MDRFNKWIKAAGLDKKSHQERGMRWVLERETAPTVGSKGGFVCDEMGLGKTILMLGAIVSNFKGKTLVVLPLALLEQWKSVIEKFYNHTPLVYHGYAAKNVDNELLASPKTPIILTTYGMIAERKNPENYVSPLWDVEWDRLICDEAHHMRNVKTGVYKGAMRLRAEIKWMVTGTPINNSAKDFYTLCNVGDQAKAFTDVKTVDDARSIIRALVLKRTKASVGIKMPDLNVHRINVEFESKEEEMFARNIHSLTSFTPITAENIDAVIRDLSMSEDGLLSTLPVYMLMRQACVMPKLAADLLKRRALQREELEMLAHIKAPKTSSKINAVVGKIVENQNTNKKKLVFCQFREEIRTIQQKLEEQGFRVSIMDGSTPKKQRTSALAPGAESPEVLVVQIQTACEGLNLQHFSEVYFTTPHWNPAVEDQAIARAHRIGQKDSVEVYHFITMFSGVDDESLDEYCANVQDAKRDAMKMIEISESRNDNDVPE